MSYPSVSTLTASFPKLDRHEAEMIRRFMRTYQVPEALRSIDGILGTHGVEYIRAGSGKRSPSILYCNAGDPYRPTILFVNGRYRVGCWGDLVERGNYA